MAKRGRPPKQAEAITQKKRGRPPKNSPPKPVGAKHASPLPNLPSKTSDPWSTALRLSQVVPSDYAMTASEQELAFNAALVLKKNAVMVELGVTYGRTAIILASAAKITHVKYYGIDNFKMGSSKEEVQTILDTHDLPGKIIKGDTNTVKWDREIDYLLIDAGHDELNMRQDVTRWLPFLNPGGLVLFHAYNPDIDYSDPHFPVKRYADERTQGWEEIVYIPNLLIKQKPA